VYGATGEGVEGAAYQIGAQRHEAVVERSGGVIGGNGEGFLKEDVSGINLVVNQKCGHSGYTFTQNQRPIDGGGAAVLGQ